MKIKNVIFVGLLLALVALCYMQHHRILVYEESEAEWVELSKLWKEKMDTCMNRNERIFDMLDVQQKEIIRLRKLKSE